jgi:hypothetical protein
VTLSPSVSAATMPVSAEQCLGRPASQISDINGDVTGTQGDTSAPTPSDHTWDLRDMTQDTAMEPGGVRYPFVLAGPTRNCVVGGRIVGGIPTDQPRDYWYGTYPSIYEGDGLRIEQSPDSWDYVHGTYVEDVSDGVTVKGTTSSQAYLDHVHMKYVRDDCIENDDTSHSITITNSLFDGCFSFLSEKAAGTSSVDQGSGPGTTTIENSLVYVNPQPLGSYCGYCTTDPQTGLQVGNYGFFKWGPSATSKVVVRNTVFRMDQRSYSSASGNRFPPGTYDNVTLVWTGGGSYPGTLQPGITVTADVSVWDKAKAAWLTGSTGSATSPTPTTSATPTTSPTPTSSATPTATTSAPANSAPTVNAGADQTVTLPSGASLAGGAHDDGLPDPPAATTTRWSTVSGPAAVTFGASGAASTSASFPTAGTYVLRLSATDGALTSSDDVTVVVKQAAASGGATGTLDRRVAAASDDSEERPRTGRNIPTGSDDLEMIYDDRDKQTVGMRFTQLGIPRGATVTKAWLEFRAEAAGSDASDLVIFGEATDDAATFTADKLDIGRRPLTTAAVPWSPAEWAAGGSYRTPDLTAVVQQVVDRSGWSAGNALAFVLQGSRGTRNAVAYDGARAAAPLLHVEYVQ